MAPSAAPPIADPTGGFLALAVEQTLLRAYLLDHIDREARLVGWMTVQRDLGRPITEQVADMCRRLGARLNRRLWFDAEDRPLLHSDDPVRRPPLAAVSIAVSPRPRLRVWLAGIGGRRSLAAAATAAAGAPVTVVGVTQLAPAADSPALAADLHAARPDAIVIAGGYDSPAPAAQEPALALTNLIAQALQRMAPSQAPAVLFAGNRFAAQAAVARLRAVHEALSVEVVNNVQPAPNSFYQTALARTLAYRHWRLCQRIPGFAKLGRWVTPPGQMTSLEWSFAQLVHAWCEYHGLPHLHGLYAAPAGLLHVWAARGQAALRLFYTDAPRPDALAGWPPIHFLSGPWPRPYGAGDSLRWWDRSAAAPVVAALGQTAPAAMLQALTFDCLERLT